MRKIRIGIIDDCVISRKILKGFLNGLKRQPYNVVFELGSLPELGNLNPFMDSPDIIFLDMDLPGVTGIDGIPVLLEYFSGCRILMFTDSENKESVIKALDAGAWGYLKKNVSPTELTLAIESVLTGQIYVSPEIFKWRTDHLDLL